MTQFKLGDRVVRFRDPWGSGNLGVEGIVTRVTMDDCEEQIYVSYNSRGTGISYEVKNFELVQTKAQPHKHADIIKSWADGAEIEVRYPDEGNLWRACPNPLWSTVHEYRVKPTPKPDTFSYIAVNDEYGVRRFTNLKDAQLYIGHQTEQFTILKLTYDGETGKVKEREIVE